jgi:hypothetical protein
MKIVIFLQKKREKLILHFTDLLNLTLNRKIIITLMSF